MMITDLSGTLNPTHWSFVIRDFPYTFRDDNPTYHKTSLYPNYLDHFNTLAGTIAQLGQECQGREHQGQADEQGKCDTAGGDSHEPAGSMTDSRERRAVEGNRAGASMTNKANFQRQGGRCTRGSWLPMWYNGTILVVVDFWDG